MYYKLHINIPVMGWILLTVFEGLLALLTRYSSYRSNMYLGATGAAEVGTGALPDDPMFSVESLYNGIGTGMCVNVFGISVGRSPDEVMFAGSVGTTWLTTSSESWTTRVDATHNSGRWRRISVYVMSRDAMV